jgi:hypothetical protein
MFVNINLGYLFNFNINLAYLFNFNINLGYLFYFGIKLILIYTIILYISMLFYSPFLFVMKLTLSCAFAMLVGELEWKVRVLLSYLYLKIAIYE